MTPFLLRVYGDSLGLPRHAARIPFAATYAELLREHLQEHMPESRVVLYNRSMGGASVTDLRRRSEADDFYFGPGTDLIVIQSGIVDCAPRPLNSAMRHLVGALPPRLRAAVIAWLHRNRARILSAGIASRVTKPRAYRREMSSWLHAAAKMAHRTYVINVAPTTPQMNDHSPGLTASIELYNRILDEVVRDVGCPAVKLIDVHSRITSELDGIATYVSSTDGHHITEAGHALYGEMLFRNAVCDFQRKEP